MNQNIVNYETDILCYRLRTARQRKRSAREGFEKKLRTLDREENALYEKEAKLGWIELNPPIQRGWNRYFVLREDVAISRHAVFFQGILNKINNIHWSNTKSFKTTRRRHKKDRLVERKQELSKPDEKHFKRLNFRDKEIQFFYEKFVRPKYKGAPEKVFVFAEPWRFVLKVKPNWITKTRVRDEAIESRLKEIDNYIRGNNLKPTLFKLRGDSYSETRWYDEDNKKDRYEFKNVPLPQILDRVREY